MLIHLHLDSALGCVICETLGATSPYWKSSRLAMVSLCSSVYGTGIFNPTIFSTWKKKNHNTAHMKRKCQVSFLWYIFLKQTWYPQDRVQNFWKHKMKPPSRKKKDIQAWNWVVNRPKNQIEVGIFHYKSYCFISSIVPFDDILNLLDCQRMAMWDQGLPIQDIKNVGSGRRDLWIREVGRIKVDLR